MYLKINTNIIFCDSIIYYRDLYIQDFLDYLIITPKGKIKLRKKQENVNKPPVRFSLALKKAIKKRNLKHLEEVINRAEKSRVFYILSQTDTMKDALALASLLRRLKRYTHRVLELKPSTVSEIHSYKRPLPIIHTVMKATYLLLGEKEKQLQVWGKKSI